MARFVVENGYQEDIRLDYVLKRCQSTVRASNSEHNWSACYVITC
jgi:hypothetical protein